MACKTGTICMQVVVPCRLYFRQCQGPTEGQRSTQKNQEEPEAQRREAGRSALQPVHCLRTFGILLVFRPQKQRTASSAKFLAGHSESSIHAYPSSHVHFQGLACCNAGAAVRSEAAWSRGEELLNAAEFADFL